MNMHILQPLICVLILSSFICRVDTLQAQTLMIDSFDKKSTTASKKYPGYRGSQEGYDVYYESANVKLSLVHHNTPDTSDKALRIEFDLSSGFWLSVRKEFPSSLNLDGYQGVELNLCVTIATPNVRLRITLSDSTDDKKDGDEMWWFDCDPTLLNNKNTKWTKVPMPFDRFYPSYGIGSRHNDGKLNLKKIIAYEVNLISEAGKIEAGRICINSFRAYK